MIANPPYGVSWRADKEFIENESENPNGRFSVGTPRISDGQLLFLQHMISKMEDKGSRIGIVFNGSPLFTGDAGSGESEIRKWVIENDWLECIVSLPDQLFFNTGITTYLWILTNKKSEKRRGKVQLIDGSSLFVEMKKSLGNKRKEVSPIQRDQILDLYLNFEEGQRSQIHPNDFFGYTKVQVEQPVVENGSVVTNQKVIHYPIPPNETTRGCRYWRTSISTTRERSNLTFQTHGWIVLKIRSGTRSISPSTFINSNPFDPLETLPKTS